MAAPNSSSQQHDPRNFIERMPSLFRFILYWWWAGFSLIALSYSVSGLVVLVQNGWKAGVDYFTSWALLAPIVTHYPALFYLTLGVISTLAPISFLIKRYEDERTYNSKIGKTIERRLPQHLNREVQQKKYLDELMRKYGTLTLPIGPVGSSFSIEAVFQPLKLRRDPLAAEDLRTEKRRALLGEPMINKDNQLLVQATASSCQACVPASQPCRTT